MPRSSRHRSHRSHKHSRDRSDSEEDGNSRERRTREEEPAASSGARVSRDPEPEKRRSSHEHAEKELVGTSNGDVSGEHGKKRKERVEEAVASDRWNGGEENEHKRSKSEELGPTGLDKSSKPKLLAPDSRGRSSRRHEGSDERDDDSGGKNVSAKQKSEKDSGRRESSSQNKDGKVRDRTERDSNRDREAQDPRHDKNDDSQSRKHGSKSGSGAEELTSKKYTKINERHAQDVLHGPETEKGFEKHMRRYDSEDKDKCLDESRNVDDRRFSFRDDHNQSRSYKDERHQDAKYRGKYRDGTERDQKHHEDKYQDERSSKDRSGDSSDKWHARDENKPLESYYKKTKLQDPDHDGISYIDDHDTKFKDRKGRKRYSDEKEDHSDLKLRGAKERREAFEKNPSSTGRIGSHNDKPRSEYHHSEKDDSSPRNNRLKSSISSSAYTGKDHNRDILKLAEYAHGEPAPEDRLCPTPSSKGDYLTSSGFPDRISSSRLGKLIPKENIYSGESFAETAAASKYVRTSRSDACTSPNRSRGRSPSANSGRRFSKRSPSKYDRTARQRLDIEVGQRSSSSKDGDRGELALEKPIIDDISQTVVCARESTPVGSSSINRGGYLSDCSPNHLLPPPLGRLGADSPSVLGPYQDDNGAQSSDRKSYSRYKRIGDLGFGRGHGNAWKGAPTWPSPVANGFVPLQHGPPPAGFHPAMSQFSAPPLFGVRPSMDLIHAGVSYHMHDESERFSVHGRPFGWHNPADQLCHPHLQMWERNSMFNNESHIYGRPEWDENSQLIGSRGWEVGSEMWKGQNSHNMDTLVSKKERESSIHSLTDELAQSKSLPTESIEAKQLSVQAPAKSAVESPQKAVTKKTPEPSNMPGDEITNYSANYLSRIDISPDLAGSDLYESCTSLLGRLDIKHVCSLTTYGCIQTNKDGSIVKMKNMSSILNTFFPTAKDDVFKRAVSVYQKQNGRGNGRHPVLAPVYSEEKKEESPGASDKVQGGANCTSLEKTFVSVTDSTNNMKAGNTTAVQDSDCPGNSKDQKSDLISDAVIVSNSSQACEDSTEECRENLSRIHDSPESTH